MQKLSFWLPSMDRWLGLSAAMIVMACGGLTYTYAVYSEHLKEILHYSQEKIDDIGVAKDFGGVVALLSGFLYNVYPPWVTIVIGALLHLFGYSMVWMTVIGKISPSFSLLCLCFSLGNGGDGWLDTACIMTSLQSFAEHRGTAMGLLKAQVGLSGAMFVMIYEAFMEPDVDKYILLMTLVPSICSLLLAMFIKPFPVASDNVDNNDSTQRFLLTHAVTIFLGLFLLATITFQAEENLGNSFQVFVTVTMLMIATSLFFIPVVHKPLDRLQRFCRKKILSDLQVFKKLSGTFPLEVISEHAIDDENQALKGRLDSAREDVIALNNKPLTMEQEDMKSSINLSLIDCLLGVDYWLITFVVMSGGGCGLAIINNFGQIGKALGSTNVNLYVGIISIWSCFGRLLSGYGSDVLMKLGCPRTSCLFASQSTMALCCLLLATGSQSALYLGSILVGLSYGSYWSLAPAILSEVFGLEAFAALYKITSVFAPLGSYILSAKVIGYLYDEQAKVYQDQYSAQIGSSTVTLVSCSGSSCFSSSLLVLALVSFVGVIVCVWFMFKTRKIYSKLTYSFQR